MSRSSYVPGFGKRLEECMKKTEKPTIQIEREMGISRNQLANWKDLGDFAGIMPENIVKICDYFGCSADYLLRAKKPMFAEIRIGDEVIEFANERDYVQNREKAEQFLRDKYNEYK